MIVTEYDNGEKHRVTDLRGGSFEVFDTINNV
jgi:hypothetical protein